MRQLDVFAALQGSDKAEMENNFQADDGARFELSTRQLRPFEDTVPWQAPARYEEVTAVVEHVSAR